MTDKTIRALYLGKLRPWNSQSFKTKAYTEHLARFETLYDKVKAALPGKERRALEEMIEEYGAAQGEVITDAFVRGFELGMRLTAEGLRTENDR